MSTTRRFLPLFSALVLGGLAAGPAWAADCHQEVDALVQDWHGRWPSWPALHAGQSSVTDGLGHSHRLAEYTAMRQRLRHARALCETARTDESLEEARVVRSWLDAEPQARSHHLAALNGTE